MEEQRDRDDDNSGEGRTRTKENERTFIERRETKGGWSREGVIGQDERRRGGGFIAGI